MHAEVMAEYWQASIPLYFCVVAAIAAFTMLAKNGVVKYVASGVFAIGLLVGLYGVWNHTEGELSKLTTLFALKNPMVVYASSDEDEYEEHDDAEQHAEYGEEGQEHEEMPYLAPMGITGLSAIALILAWPERKRPASEEV